MDTLFINSMYELASVEVGEHFYWNFGEYQVHGQVLINSWIVIALILAFAVATTRELKAIPEGGQNLVEYVLEFIRDIAKTQIGEKEYLRWTPYIGTMFLFILYRIGLEL